MEARELPDEKATEPTSETPKKTRKGYFTKLQAFLILFVTLIACLGGGYYISDKYLWSNTDINRLNQQLDYYKKLVDKEPNNPENRVNLGYTFYVKGDNDNAIKQLLLAKDLDKNYFKAYFNLGIVYNDTGRYDDAIKQAKKAVEIAPRDYEGYLLEGMSYRKLKMYKEALDALEEANQLMPANTDIITEIGRVAEDQKKYKDAEKIYKEALSYDPMYKPAAAGLKRIAGKTKGN